MRKNDNSRQGIAIAEFALILPLLLVPLLAGAWDVSKMIDINQVLTRAAREGVVMASRGNDPSSRVQEYIEAVGLSATNLTVTVEHGAEDELLGQEVRVHLAYDFSDDTFFPWDDFLSERITSAASAKME